MTTATYSTFKELKKVIEVCNVCCQLAVEMFFKVMFVCFFGDKYRFISSSNLYNY